MLASALLVTTSWGLQGQTAKPAAKPNSNAIAAAVAALGASNLQTIKYSGFGSIYAVGQSPDPASPWPRVTLKRYEASIDYPGSAMQVELVREMGALPPRGGGPSFSGEQRQMQAVNGSIAWDVPFGPPPPPAPGARASGAPPAPPPGPPGGRGALVPQAPQLNAAAANERRQVIWTTPHGFLKAALANQPALQAAGTGTEVSFFAGTQRFVGFINARNQVERVRTWIEHPVLGELVIDTTYSGYEAFGKILFPTRITQRQGAHPALDLFIDTVTPNAPVTVPVPDGLNVTPPAPSVQVDQIAPGVFYLTGGTHHSVALAMPDHVVLIEAPLSEERSKAVLAQLRETLPGKPVRVVISTHPHFDHVAGLRVMADEGARILTHATNAKYLESLWNAPRAGEGERPARPRAPATFITFTDKHVLEAGDRRIEVHLIADSPHYEAMAMVYLPAERLLIEADAYTPADVPAGLRQGGPPPGGAPGVTATAPPINPVVLNLYQNIQRLRLDVGSVVPLHGSRVVPLADVVSAAGGL